MIKNQEKTINDELTGLLMAISIVSKRLAKNLKMLDFEKRRSNRQRKPPPD